MTQEEKELLLKDLCSRLPYNVVVNCTEEDDEKTNFNCFLAPDMIKDIKSETAYWIIKPYLRPMSSMTEEERKEYKHLVAFSGNSYGAADLVDWLNKKMFAYRAINGKDMFELELALEAPEGMYKI